MCDVDIDFPEEISSISTVSSTGSDVSDVNVDFPEDDSLLSYNSYYLFDDYYDPYECVDYGSNWTLESIPDTKEYEDLPHVDYKYSSRPTRSRSKFANMKTFKGQKCFARYVQKELEKPENLSAIQNAFRFDNGCIALAEKSLYCTSTHISLTLSSPIFGITKSYYVDRMKNSELAKDFAVPFEEPDQAVKSSVLAVDLRWRNGIEVSSSDDFCHRTKRRGLGPPLKKIKLTYDSKKRFAKKVKEVRDGLFPDWRQNLVVINGREGTPKMSVSANIQKDDYPRDSYTFGYDDLHTRTWKEYTDLKEHKILVVPDYSKRNGFDMDLDKCYEVPYEVTFMIEKRSYQHQFLLRLPLSRHPQHYGLIFTFAEDPKGHTKLRVKTLFSVHSVYPESCEDASLETYVKTNFDPSKSEAISQVNYADNAPLAKASKNGVQVLKDNLKQEKLLDNGWNWGRVMVNRNFTFKGRAPFADISRFHIDEWAVNKKKAKKNQRRKDIKFILRDLSQDGTYESTVGGACAVGYYDHTPFEDCAWCGESVDTEYRPFRGRLEVD